MRVLAAGDALSALRNVCGEMAPMILRGEFFVAVSAPAPYDRRMAYTESLRAKIDELTALSDELSRAVEEWRLKYETAKREWELTQARLDGLKIAKEMLGSASLPARAPARHEGVIRGRGKQPGTLSKEWRAVLAAHVASGNAFASPKDIAAHATSVGHPVEMKPTRDRLRKYLSIGFTERDGDLYRVSQDAIERFGLAPEKATAQTRNAATTDLEAAA